MDLGSLLFLLLVLACPLAMFWMMRGGHGAHGHAGHGSGHDHGTGGGHGSGHDHGHETSRELRSVEELRRQRAELDDEIAALEQATAGAEKTATA